MNTLSRWTISHFILFPSLILVQSCLIQWVVDEAIHAFETGLIFWNKRMIKLQSLVKKKGYVFWL